MLRKILPSLLFPKEEEVEPEQQVLAFNRKYGYTTSFGHIIVSWSRRNFREPSVCTVVGFAVPDSKRTSSSTAPAPDTTKEITYQPFSFVVSPTEPHEIRGLRQFVVMNSDRPTEPLRSACFAWDFSCARCPIPGSVEPSSSYYFTVVVDSQMVILLGDQPEWAYRVTQVRPGPSGVLISREDRIKLKAIETEYKTSVVFGGVERKISINLTHGMLALMSVEIDGRQVVAVQSLFKMFRGTAKFDLADGNLIQITWDLHAWLFRHADDNIPEDELVVQEKEDGLFMFSFIEQGVNTTARRNCPGKYVDVMRSCRKLSWWKLVEEWVSPEEERMYKGETFCFMVYLYKD